MFKKLWDGFCYLFELPYRILFGEIPTRDYGDGLILLNNNEDNQPIKKRDDLWICNGTTIKNMIKCLQTYPQDWKLKDTVVINFVKNNKEHGREENDLHC